MNNSTSEKRAAMPEGTTRILNTRSVSKSNANLLSVLKPGQFVLDAGCGAGAITAGICDYVGEEGRVVGVDSGRSLIAQAQENFCQIKNLAFYCSDILVYETNLRFDVITIARTLQWLSNPAAVIQRMKNLLKDHGVLCVLDYDHTAIEWNPAPPAAMLYFYQAFLKWRAEAGMDNKIGNHVADLMNQHNMEVLVCQDQSEYFENGAKEFPTHINLWSVVAETRGKQMVEDKYLTEEERLQAITDYQAWLPEAKSMRLVLKATHAGKRQSV